MGKSGCLFAIIVVLFFFFVVGSVGDDSGSSRPTDANGFDDIDVRVGCEDLVRQNLKSPGTAKFPGPFSGDYGEVLRSGEGWLYVSHVDSQNSFGAMLRTSFTCRVDGQGQMRLSMN